MIRYLLCVTIFFLLTNISKAQLYKQAENSAKQQAKVNVELNQVYTNNLPNGFYNRQSKINILPATTAANGKVYTQSADDKRRDSIRKVEAIFYNKAQQVKHNRALYDANSAKQKFTAEQFAKIKNAGTMLEDFDLQEYCEYIYFDNVQGTQFLQYFGRAIQNLRSHLADATQSNLDSCLTRLWYARLFPHTTLRELDKLIEKYPQYSYEISLRKLQTMPFLFGAFTPNYVKLGYNDPNYPICQYEMADDFTKTEILNEFLDLYYMFPEITLAEIAGKARLHFNPFELVANHGGWGTPISGATQELRFKMRHLHLMTAVEPATGSKDERKAILERRLGEAARRMRDIYPLYVTLLSPKD